jgi:hypothetical protein
MFRYTEFAYQAGNIFTLQVFISQAFDMRWSVFLPKLVITFDTVRAKPGDLEQPR